MSLNRPDLVGRIWYKYLIFSGVIGLIFIVIRVGSEVSTRTTAEAHVVDAWSDDCAATVHQVDCEEALETHERGCLRAARDFEGDRMIFQKNVFYECMNERNRVGIRLSPPTSTLR